MKFSWGSPFKRKSGTAADSNQGKGLGKAQDKNQGKGNAHRAQKAASGRIGTSGRAKAAPRADQHPFRSVSVYSRDLNCCAAAKRIDGHKFLAAHAPELPLGGCSNQGRCSCRYRHYLDRRSDTRRDEDFGLPNRNYIVNERRSRKDRRRTV